MRILACCLDVAIHHPFHPYFDHMDHTGSTSSGSRQCFAVPRIMLTPAGAEQGYFVTSSVCTTTPSYAFDLTLIEITE